MPKRRSVDMLLTSGERLKLIMNEVSNIQSTYLSNRVHVLSTQEKLKDISDRMNESLDKQEENLEKLKQLALAR